jgi:predicted RecB family endonuclease
VPVVTKSPVHKILTGGQFGGNNIGVPQEERALIDDVQRRLAEKYAALPADHVAAIVRHAYLHFQSSRVRGFIPLLVQRRADEELEELSVLLPDLAAVALDDMTAAGV